jgi:ligand-binding sensor domain-containing protein
LCNGKLYIASYHSRSIYIYQTIDEITFNKIHTISTLELLVSITINSGKIYTGTNNGRILVYNKTNNALVQVMHDMCLSHIRSVKFDCNGNMIYSCLTPPMVIVIGTNGINSTLLLSGTFTQASEIYIDSKNRLWIGGNNGIVIYN